MVYICAQNNIPVESPEPKTYEEIAYLLKKFSKDDIMYYYFSRIVHHWHRRNDTSTLKSFVEHFMNKYKKITQWADFDFSFDHFVSIHNSHNNHEFTEQDSECMYTNSNPSYNPVSSTLSHYRDVGVINSVLNYWQRDFSVFIVYGSGHAIVQEPALKHLLVKIDLVSI